MYKLVTAIFPDGNIKSASIVIRKDGACIPFDQANTDYANFKAAILADKATLQDADGNEMTAQQAKDFVQELP